MQKRLLTSLIILGIFITLSLPGFAKNNDSIKVFHLKNGHTVVIKEVHVNPLVTVDTWVKTGSMNEDDKINGVSHFLEHLLFKGTKNRKNGEAEKILESKGAGYNAATSKDFTHYFTTIASQHAELALDLQSDMLLNALIPEEELDNEKKVVQEEIRRALDDPDRILFNNLNNILFKQHPYKYETLGTMDTIQNVSRKEILDYYHKWYVPSNMTTVIIGDINTEKMLALVKEKFKSEIVSDKKLQVTYNKEPFITKPEENLQKGDFSVGYLQIGFKGVPIYDKKDNYALDLAASILGDGRSSRLYQNVKENLNLVSSISSGHHSMKDDSIFYVYANLKPEDYTAAKNAILKEIKLLRDEKVSDEELKRAKTKAQREFLYNSESVQDIASTIGYHMTIGEKLNYYTDYIDNINKITAEDIQNAAIKYLSDSRTAISTLLPDKNTPISVKNEENYKNVAKLALDKELTIVSEKNTSISVKNEECYKNVTKSVLNNGMTIISEKNTSNDIASLSIFIKGGKLTETIPGLLDIIELTLMKGTKNKTAIEISNELENSGIIIAPSVNPDYFEIQLKSTVADFDKAFVILADIINNPTFEDEYIQKAKSNLIQNIQESRDNPLSYSFEKFMRTIYEKHPYGNIGDIVEKNLDKIQRENLISFYKDFFIPENMVVSVSGNIDHANLVNKFQSYFPNIEGKKIDVNSLLSGYQPLKQNLFSSVNKDIAAASMLLGWPVDGIKSEKDYASLKIINAILGNGLSSRLFVNLREKQGLAYAISSIYSSRLDNSFFVLYIGTKPENVNLAKKLFLQEIEKIKTESVSEQELNDAKQKLIGQFALLQETNQQKAHSLGWFEVSGKGFKFNYEYPDLINSITVGDIMNTANKYFNAPYAISIIAPAKNVESLKKDYKSESKR